MRAEKLKTEKQLTFDKGALRDNHLKQLQEKDKKLETHKEKI